MRVGIVCVVVRRVCERLLEPKEGKVGVTRELTWTTNTTTSDRAPGQAKAVQGYPPTYRKQLGAWSIKIYFCAMILRKFSNRNDQIQ